jgi:hypothetical protein
MHPNWDTPQSRLQVSGGGGQQNLPASSVIYPGPLVIYPPNREY